MRSAEVKGRRLESALARTKAGLEKLHWVDAPRPSREILDKLFDTALASTFDWACSTRDTEDGTKKAYAEFVVLMKWRD